MMRTAGFVGVFIGFNSWFCWSFREGLIAGFMVF